MFISIINYCKGSNRQQNLLLARGVVWLFCCESDIFDVCHWSPSMRNKNKMIAHIAKQFLKFASIVNLCFVATSIHTEYPWQLPHLLNTTANIQWHNCFRCLNKKYFHIHWFWCYGKVIYCSSGMNV